MRFRRSKYGNVATVVEGLRFDSKREARRWRELQLLERAGEIKDLRRQVPFALMVGGTTIATYRADFCYWEGARYTVEDSKGFKTEAYRLKKKLMKACHDIDIRET